MHFRWFAVLLPLMALLLAAPAGQSAPLPNDTPHLNYQDSGLFGPYFTYCFDDLTQPATGRRAVADRTLCPPAPGQWRAAGRLFY